MDTITLVLHPSASGTSAATRPVLAAALSLFDRLPVRLMCVLDRDPGLDDLAAFLSDCSDVIDLTLPTSPDVLLVGPTDATDVDALVSMHEAGGDIHTRRMISALQSVAASVRTRGSAPGSIELPAPTPIPAPTPAQKLVRARAITEEILLRRDAERRSRIDRRVHVLAVVQNLHTWGSLAPIVAALRRRDDAKVTVVALDDPIGTPGSVAAALAAQGIPTSRVADLVDLLDVVDVALLSDPYEEFRPTFLHVESLLERGVRLAYSPYAENIGGEVGRHYDTPLHNLAWRVFVPDEVQRDLYAQHCTCGAGHVRALGSLKADWLLAGEQATLRAGTRIRQQLGTATVALWNPHFRLGHGGWSTFERYYADLLLFTGANPRVGLILRPHPRLFADTQASGPAGQATVRSIRDTFASQPNVVLDESSDYRPAFAASDAMISDLSSLIPEYLRTGKPVAYLRHPEPPATVADDAWLTQVDVVDSARELVRYLRALTPHRSVTAAGRASPDTGAGERAAAEIVEGLQAEVWRARA